MGGVNFSSYPSQSGTERKETKRKPFLLAHRKNDSGTAKSVRINGERGGKREQKNQRKKKKTDTDRGKRKKKKSSGTLQAIRTEFHLHNHNHCLHERTGIDQGTVLGALSPSGRDRENLHKNQRFPKLNTRVFATLLSIHIRQRWPHRLIFGAHRSPLSRVSKFGIALTRHLSNLTANEFRPVFDG